jgi:hypothetical protein
LARSLLNILWIQDMYTQTWRNFPRLFTLDNNYHITTIKYTYNNMLTAQLVNIAILFDATMSELIWIYNLTLRVILLCTWYNNNSQISLKFIHYTDNSPIIVTKYVYNINFKLTRAVKITLLSYLPCIRCYQTPFLLVALSVLLRFTLLIVFWYLQNFLEYQTIFSDITVWRTNN